MMVMIKMCTNNKIIDDRDDIASGDPASIIIHL